MRLKRSVAGKRWNCYYHNMFTIYLPKPVERKIEFFNHPGMIKDRRIPAYGAIQVQKGHSAMANIALWIDEKNHQLSPPFFQTYALPGEGFQRSIDAVQHVLTPEHEAYCAFHLQWFYWEKYVKTVDVYWEKGLITLRPDPEDALYLEVLNSEEYRLAQNAFYFLYPMLQELSMMVPEETWIPIQWVDVLEAFQGQRSWPSILPKAQSSYLENDLYL